MGLLCLVGNESTVSYMNNVSRNEVRSSSRDFKPTPLRVSELPPEGYTRYEVVSVLYEREKAMLLRIGAAEVWLPKKVITTGIDERGKLVIDVPDWLAAKHKHFTERVTGQERGLRENSEKVDTHCIIYQSITSETDKAYQLRFSINKPLVWLPKGQVELGKNKNNENVVFVPHWLAVTHKLVKPPKKKLRKIVTLPLKKPLDTP